MRLGLSNDGKTALERIQAHCREINPDIERSASTFLLKTLLALEQILSKDQWIQLAAQMTSERIRRKRIADRLIKLGEKLDESDIAKLERKTERKCAASSSDSGVISAENS